MNNPVQAATDPVVDESALRQQCGTVLPGHRQQTPAQAFAAMAAWCEENGIAHDVYGDGELIGALERKVAALLGKEAAVFCITGTMAQATALRLACADRGSRLVALHTTAHILKHERGNHQLLDHFHALQVGSPHRPFTVDDLAAIPDHLGAVSMELPAREIGGMSPAWEELAAIKAWCAERGTHLHMDGARLWEAAAAFGKSPAEIAAGFDSVYVSLYKGIGGLGGALLAGSAGFVARAQEWYRRQGGSIIHRTPYVVAAAMQIDARLAAMPALYRRTQWLYEALRGYPLLRVNPARPHANIFHLHLPVERDRAIAIRNDIAREHRIWLHNAAHHAQLEGSSYTEWYVGDQLLDLPDDQVHAALAIWHAALKEATQ
ncbi:threonine aldolase family protein [Pseudoduganella umbonata]|uniref:Threonine aldolase n=1 Tax=Pseudoduganella umbonata TaxID=864828 RepID=A0A4P8HNB4_9BURK|nr:beta-eliminating lyase-related protein [Pseudoduganella umbonata]MBB3219888.1 threonine aldolase [Pseudoduganella umbonata]QCP09912.1 threonine aldolase [Pseudoduganella umbonata]